MINGLEIKIPHTNTDGSMDCETAYIASFRKCPKMAKMATTLQKGRMDLLTLGKRMEKATEAMQKAETDEEIEMVRVKIHSIIDSMETTGNDLDALALDMLGTGFKEAGYDADNARRLAEAIPLDRIDEVLAVCRTGAGMADFFTGRLPSGGR